MEMLCLNPGPRQEVVVYLRARTAFTLTSFSPEVLLRMVDGL
jgi:hypothetical protein